MTKRYFITNTLKTDLPLILQQSTNRRYIHFIHCRLVLNNALIGDVTVHADFVIDLPYLNNFVSFANIDLSKRKKYEVLNNPREIKIWFQDLQGNIVAVNNDDFVLELMLEF